MLIAYKARIYPNKQRRELIERTFGCSRFVWNHMLDRGNKMYLRRGESFSRFDMCYALTGLKQVYPWLHEVDSTALTATIDNLNEAKQAFFRKDGGFPDFKSKRNPVKSYTTKSASVRYENGFVRLPKLGELRMHNHKLPANGCKIKRAIVSMNAANEYYVSLLVENAVTALPASTRSIGIDVGVDSFLVDSDGNKVDNPRFYSKSQSKLAKEQRKLSKKRKSSNNYNKQKLKAAKQQLKIQRQREHFHNCLVKQLTDENQVICVESLNVKGMLKRKKKLPRKAERSFHESIADVGWAQFITKLEAKAQMTGRTVVKVHQYYPSSQRCHCCGHINPATKDLSVRAWTCPECSAKHDRDINAAINILQEGMRMIA